MFQFPGFAFINLCIQSINTWFTSLLAAPKSSNNKVSGGLPHSEIHGSKPILSSPWLIAEYHVFHRLLLPRHSPNALFALDLIQKKKDLRQSRQQKLVRNCHLYSEPKAYFPARFMSVKRTIERSVRIVRVSVLDLDNMFFSTMHTPGRPRKQPRQTLASARRHQHKVEVFPLLGKTKHC